MDPRVKCCQCWPFPLSSASQNSAVGEKRLGLVVVVLTPGTLELWKQGLWPDPMLSSWWAHGTYRYPCRSCTDIPGISEGSWACRIVKGMWLHPFGYVAHAYSALLTWLHMCHTAKMGVATHPQLPHAHQSSQGRKGRVQLFLSQDHIVRWTSSLQLSQRNSVYEIPVEKSKTDGI